MKVFKFPTASDIEQLEQLGISRAYEYIRKKQLEYQDHYFLIKRSAHRGKYNYYSCKICKARFKLQFQNSTCLIKILEQQHRHSPQETLVQKAYQFYIQKNIYRVSQAGFNLLKERFPQITEYQYAYLKRQYEKEYFKSYNEICRYFQQQNKVIWKYLLNQQKQIEVAFFCNEEMQADYHKYCDNVGFDATFNLQLNQLKAAPLVGLNYNNSMIILGICFIRHLTKDNYSQILKFIKASIGTPEVLVTDGESAIVNAITDFNQELNQLQRPIVHVLDIHHTLKSVKKSIKDKQLQNLYTNVIMERSYLHAFDALMAIESKSKSEFQKAYLRRFKNNIDKISYSNAPNAFIHKMVTSHGEKIHDLIKARIKSETNLFVLIKQYSELAHQLNVKQKPIFYNPVELYDLLQWDGIDRLCTIYDTFAVNCLVKTYIRSKDFLKEKIKPNVWCVSEIQNRVFQYIVEEKQDKLICECGLAQKTGFPCPHILALRPRVQLLLPLINKRWQIPFGHVYQKEDYKKLGRRRLTRRNRDRFKKRY